MSAFSVFLDRKIDRKAYYEHIFISHSSTAEKSEVMEASDSEFVEDPFPASEMAFFSLEPHLVEGARELLGSLLSSY